MQTIRFSGFLLALLFLSACTDSRPPVPLATFEGSEQARKLAEDFFQALGGKERWAKVRSLYIRAVHEQPNLEHPYQSEIWRDLDSFRLRIRQRGEEFDRLGVFNEQEGVIFYLDRDSLRRLPPDFLAAFRRNHDFNIYVLLHRLAREPDFRVEIAEGNRLNFLADDSLLVGFQLDERLRPVRFFTPAPDGGENASTFTRFDSSGGFLHPTAGGPDDGSFTFLTRQWTPSEREVESAFNIRCRTLQPTLDDLAWLTGTWARELDGRGSYEVWERTDEGALQGIGFALLDEDTLFRERLRIEARPQGLVYIATVEDQNQGRPVEFPLLGAVDHRFFFHNPEHDFPTLISYRFQPPDSLFAAVRGWQQGTEKRMLFPFRKASPR